MSIRINLFLLLLILIKINSFSIDSSKRFILDNNGRYSIFHGANVVVKLPPYLPNLDKFDYLWSLNTEQDLLTMKRLGFNNVRLGVIWESVETAPGVYDEEYLNQVEKIINTLGENGIYTIVDAHQDVFSRNFCGEGVPYFYVNDMGYEKKCDANLLTRILDLAGVCKTLDDFNFNYDEKGLPLIEDCKKYNFVEYHYLIEFSSIYQNFYSNKLNIQEKFVEFWKHVVNRLKGNKYILGYDLWNEPFPGALLENLKSLIPSYSDQNQVLPIYKKVDEELRKIDPDYILFFENTPFPDTIPLFGGLTWGGMKEKPADDDKNQVYNFHAYCCLAGADACQHGEAPMANAINICPKFHNKLFNNVIKVADNLNIPRFLTEFGACSDSLACYKELMNVVTICEKNFISWSYWNYKPYGDHTTSAIELVEYEGIFNADGTVQQIKERALSRGYVQYYQGKPVDFLYEENSETDFSTMFEYNKNITEPSVLYYNKNYFYKKGYVIEVIDDDTKENLVESKKVEIKESDSCYLNISCNGELLDDGTKVRINFKAVENN